MAVGPAQRNFLIPQGTYFTFALVWKNRTTGLPIDLTGYVAKLQAKKTFESEAALTLESDEYAPTDEYGGILITPAAGRLDFYFTAAITNIPAGTYKYDCLLTAAGKPTRLIEGALQFTPRVTV